MILSTLKPPATYSTMPDHMRQKIVSYLSVFDLQKVATVNKTTRKWLMDNSDKHIMREGQPLRRLKIDLYKFEESEKEIMLSPF